MKAIKRTVAGLLASVMLMSSVSVSLGAETYTADEAVVVAKVNAAGIMTGTDNGFEPSKTLTRAEAAAIMVRMKGIPEAQVKSAAGTTLFGDVSASHWAAGYINVASSLGIIKGVGANTFAPDRTVTIAEMTTMAVRALGAGQLVEAQAGTWPTNYMNFAGEEKLTDGVFNIYTAEATRLNAATIVANTLEAPIWEKSQVTTNNEVTWAKQSAVKNANGTITAAKTILSETLEITRYEDYLLTTINTKDRKLGGKNVEYQSVTFLHDVADSVDMASLDKATEYDIWYSLEEKEIVGVWKSEDSKQQSYVFTEITKDLDGNNKIELMIDGNAKEYTVLSTATVFYNGLLQNNFNKLVKNVNAFGKIVLDGNSKISSIIIEEYSKVGLVDSITSNSIKFKSSDLTVANEYSKVSSIPVKEDDYEYAVTKDGKEIKVTDIKEGDVLYFYETTSDASVKKFVILVMTDAIEGTVTSVSTKSIKIDGKKYSKADSLSVSVEAEVKAYRNPAGKIVLYEELEGTTGDLAIITSLRQKTAAYTGGVQVLEAVFTSLDGTPSDVLEIDLDETKDVIKVGGEVDENNIYTESIDYTDLANIDTNSLVGSLVRYEISGNKAILKEFIDLEVSPAKLYTTKVDAEKNIKPITSFSYDDDKMQLTKNTDTYRITANTTIIKVKALGDVTKEAAKYSVKYEIINPEDLGYGTYSGYIANIDADTNKIGVLVLDINSNARYASSKTYAILASKATIKDGDFKSELTFLTADEVVEVKSTKAATGFAIGGVYDIKVENDILADSSLVTDNDISDDSTFLYTINDDTLKTAGGKVYDLADSVIYVSKDSEMVHKPGTAGDIICVTKDVLEGKEPIDTVERTEVRLFTVVNTETSKEEVIAVIYAKEETDASDLTQDMLVDFLDANVGTTYVVEASGTDKVTLTQKTAEDTSANGTTITVLNYVFTVTTQGIAAHTDTDVDSNADEKCDVCGGAFTTDCANAAGVKAVLTYTFE